MSISEIIDELQAKVWKAKRVKNTLYDAYSVGEALPEGFNSWGEVKRAITNWECLIADLEYAINNCYVWRNSI